MLPRLTGVMKVAPGKSHVRGLNEPFFTPKVSKEQSDYEVTMKSILKKWKYSSQWPRDMVDSSLDRYLIGDE